MNRWKMRYTGHLGLRAPDAPLFPHSARSTDPVDQIDFLADIGFAGVQDNFLKLRPVNEQERIGRAIARRGLQMGTFNNNPLSWNRPLWSGADQAARSELLHDLEMSIEAAARTGGRYLTCVTAADPARAHDAQIADMIENLKRLAEPAEKAGMILCVEAVANAWIPGLLVSTLADAAAIVQAVASPAVKLQFDVAHVEMSEGNAFARLQDCWSDVALVQAADTPADAPGRIDLGAGTLEWPAILRWISAQGYAGLIEIEHQPLEESAEGEQRLIDRLHAVDQAI